MSTKMKKESLKNTGPGPLSETCEGCASDLYGDLFQNSQSIMLIIDPRDGSIIAANTAAENFYGYDRDQMTAMKISDINMLSDEEVKTEMQLAHNQKRNHFFFRHLLSDQSVRDVEVYSGPVHFDGHNYLYSIIHDITDRLAVEREKEALLDKLERALEEIRVLKDVLPTCAHCRKIRNEQGHWQDVEEYIREHTNTRFSHGICGECSEKLFSDH